MSETANAKGASKGEKTTKGGWTIMLYVVGGDDDDGAAAARESLLRAKEIGSTSNFDVFVEYDPGSRRGPVKRLRLKPSKEAAGTAKALRALNADSVEERQRAFEALTGLLSLSEDAKDLFNPAQAKEDHKDDHEVLEDGKLGKREKLKTFIFDAALAKDDPEDLEERNLGRPAVLREFIRWATSRSNREHRMLIIWGEGDGFSLAGDSTLRTFLRSTELREALRDGPSINILGFNSCMMATLETYYELDKQVEYAVGSEGYTPETSWPYEDILGALEGSNGMMTPRELAKGIVEIYDRHYSDPQKRRGEAVDLSACNVSGSATVVSLLHHLVNKLLHRVEAAQDWHLKDSIISARLDAQPYESDCVDLYDFCRLLSELSSENERSIYDTCKEVMSAIELTVIDFRNHGDEVQSSHGVSIYFPSSRVSTRYRDLNLLRETCWNEFLHVYLKWVDELLERLQKATPDPMKGLSAKPH